MESKIKIKSMSTTAHNDGRVRLKINNNMYNVISG